MNADNEQELIAAARAINAGIPVNWADLESASATESSRAVLRQLRVIAEIAYLHRNPQAIFDTPSSITSSDRLMPAPADTARFLTGSTWGSLTVIERVGQGTFGDVYRARDPRLDRDVALKILRHAETDDTASDKAVIEEGRLLARVRHPNVVSVYGADQIQGQVGLWMEFVNGRTLADEVRANGPLAAEDAIQIGISVCRALSAVHRAGLLYRDLKAQNVMREATGRIVLMDFGAVHESAAGGAELTGTPLYLAPEVFARAPATVRNDIYGVGVLLFHLVTGSYPVLGRTLGEIREAHASRRRRSLGDVKGDVPAGFVKLVERALELDPDRRYESAEAMEAALNSVEPRGLPSRPPETVHDIQGMFRSRTLQLSVLTLLVAAGVTAAVAMRPDPTPLTERDVVMVADFDNTTGDSVFDVMLREALSVRLAQSSFLNTVPDTRIRETLHLMERPDDTRITHAIARDICQRLGTKAVLGGSIAPLGSHYVLTVTATNCRTGELLVREQREAPSKERVLTTLSDAASSLQNKLGESLASVQTFTPPDEWRTSSLDALRAFTEGRQLHGRGRSGQAIPHLIRALEIDPQLLGAHRELGAAYYYVGEFRRGREQLAKAYALRDRGTESQRQFITASYYRHGIGNREKAREASEFWRRNFPDNGTAAMFCALENSDVGRFEEGVALLYESNRLGVPVGHNLGANLANLLRGLHRYNEAKGIVARAAESGFDTALMHSTLYTVAFIEGDARAMQREVEWFKGKDTEHLIIANQAATAAFGGQIGESRRLQQQAIELALRADRDEVAAEYRSAQALVEAMIGNDREVLEERLRFHVTSGNGPLALAFAGRGRAARQFTDQSRKEWPEHTLLNAVSLPTAMAALEIRNGDAAKAIGLLEAARAFEPVATSLRAAYTRGLAYLKLGAGIEAAKEFQKVLDHRGVLPLSVLYPLSQLGLARAQVLAGDHAAAVKAYKDFFTTWKHADLDIPVFVQAWQEYARISP